MNDQEFKDYLQTLTLETVISAQAFTHAVTSNSNFQNETRAQMLRKRASEVGIKSGAFDKMLSGFQADMRKLLREKEQQSKGNGGPAPEWVVRGNIDEPKFCEYFRQEYDLHFVNGAFYSATGIMDDAKLKSLVQDEISPYISMKLAVVTNGIVKALENLCYTTQPEPDTERIHVKNGFVTLDGKLESVFPFTLNRLNVWYNPDAPAPEKWLKFLSDLLEPDDILTLQEYLGYCLLPLTKAQIMLFLLGNGGEGKSVIGVVMKAIFGDSMTGGSLRSLEENRFASACLSNRLLFVDDDLSTNACKESEFIKKIITAEGPTRFERKGKDSWEEICRCRLLAFGNVPFSTLYDHSEGAFRRRVIVRTKPKAEGREDNRNLADEIKRDELPGVFNWMLDGLQRLTKNHYRITISTAAREAMDEIKRESFNVPVFLDDDGYILLGVPDSEASNADIYATYEHWCKDNCEVTHSSKTLTRYLKENQGVLHIKYDKHVNRRPGESGVRGFKRVKLLRLIGWAETNTQFPN